MFKNFREMYRVAPGMVTTVGVLFGVAAALGALLAAV